MLGGTAPEVAESYGDRVGTMGAWVVRAVATLRWRWSFLGLALTLAVLGHDIAMAHDAHDITSAPSPTAGEHQRPHASKLPPTFHGQHPEHLPQRDCGVATCPALATCNVGWVAASARADADAITPPTTGEGDQLLQDQQAGPSRSHAARVPPLSPRVRRALLQVFLN